MINLPRSAIHFLLFRLLIIASFVLPVQAQAAQWSMSVDDKSGLPVLSKDGTVALAGDFVFWGNNWKWAGLDKRFQYVKPFEYSLTGKSAPLNLELQGRIKKVSERQLQWQFRFDARTAMNDVIGGGIKFIFSPALFDEMGSPELLPGNRGWVWGGHKGMPRFEMRFDTPVALVTFEPGRKEEIRAYFYTKVIPAGKQTFTATLTVQGEASILPTQMERFGIANPRDWPASLVDGKSIPVDLSFLNEKPAGKRGLVKASGDALAFADGSSARFWGTNLTAYALFATPKDKVKQQARRLAALGFNLVRFTHHDSPWVNPNIFGKNATDTRKIDPQMMEKLDWWIKCLKDQGIYVWLDLHVHRAFKAADGIDGFNELSKGKAEGEGKGYNYVNQSMQKAMKRFNENYLVHVNPYTATRIADEPAVLALQLTNENDVTHHFGNALLPDKKVPYHNSLYMHLAEDFAKAHGLPKDKTWRSWEQGPAKIFLNDLQHRFDADMTAHLRSIRAKPLIVTTSLWGDNLLSAIPALTGGDMVDVHSYGGVGDIEKNPFYSTNFVHRAAVAQVSGKPLSVSEWNAESFTHPDRHSEALYVAASAALQGWDALMQYAYSQQPFNDDSGSGDWQAFNDPALLATLPAAALAYRQGHVHPARTIYAFAPTADMLFNRVISADNAPALRVAAEIGKLVFVTPAVKELPWLQAGKAPSGSHLITDPNQRILPASAVEVVSDTGELKRNWKQGIFTINTAGTQAATGWLGGKKLSLNSVEIAATTKYASIAVQSLDGKSIEKTRRIMISLSARVMPEPGKQFPYHSEPVEGKLTIKASKGLRLFKRDAKGALKEVPVSYQEGRYHLTLNKALATHWLFLQ